MNFYFLFFFVILCFGPSDAAREAYHEPRKTSARAREETKRKFGDAGLSIINGLVQAKNWVNLFRRLLKSLRKWCNTHPPEIKLGKCFLSYFNIKIPGLRRYEKNGRCYEGLIKTEYLTKTLRPEQKAIAECKSQRGIFRKTSFGIHLIFLAQRTFTEILNRLRQYHDIVLKNDLLVCLWNYFWKKFWIWIDSVPDVRFLV